MPNTSKAYHHGDLRNALLEAATNIIAEIGIEALSMRELARRLGVSAGAPFRHFDSKDALLAAVGEQAMQRLVATVDLALAQTNDDPLADIEAIGLAYLEWVINHPTHFVVISQRALVKLEGGARDDNDAIRERMRALLTLAQDRGQLPPEADLNAILLSCRALVYGLGRMFVDGHFPEWQPDGTAYAHMQRSLRGYIASLRHDRQKPSP